MLYRRLLKTKPKDVDEQSGLTFTWSETPKSGFLLQELKTAVPLYSYSQYSVNKIKSRKLLSVHMSHMSQYSPFQIPIFVVSLLISRNKMVKFSILNYCCFGVGAVQVLCEFSRGII